MKDQSTPLLVHLVESFTKGRLLTLELGCGKGLLQEKLPLRCIYTGYWVRKSVIKSPTSNVVVKDFLKEGIIGEYDLILIREINRFPISSILHRVREASKPSTTCIVTALTFSITNVYNEAKKYFKRIRVFTTENTYSAIILQEPYNE